MTHDSLHVTQIKPSIKVALGNDQIELALRQHHMPEIICESTDRIDR